MEGQKFYFVTIRGAESYLPELLSEMQKATNNAGLSDVVDIRTHRLKFVDYGVNPIADGDLRPFVMINTLDGSRLMTTPKFIPRDKDIHIGIVMDAIKKHRSDCLEADVVAY